MNQNLLIDSALKGESYEKTYKSEIFSSYFQNIKELQNFLKFTQHNFVGDNPTLILGISYQVWKNPQKSLKGGTYGKK